MTVFPLIAASIPSDTVMDLKDTQARNAKPKAKPYKIPAGGGLYLLVTATGSKLWRYDYRFSDKRKTLALGAYPDVSCKAAGEAHRAARTRLAEGDDPAAAKQRGSGSPSNAWHRPPTPRSCGCWKP